MDDSIAVCTATHVGWKEPDYRVSQIFHLIESMNNCEEREKLDISIVDCSDKVPQFAGMIREKWKGNRFVYTYDPKAKRHPDMPNRLWISYAFNIAVRQCQAEKIFICGMDAVLPPDFAEQYDRNVGERKVWSPIVQLASKDGNPMNYWRTTGRGVVGILKKDYWAIGGQDERHNMPKWVYGKNLWGDKKRLRISHDKIFFMNMQKAGYEIMRANSNVLSLDHPDIDPTVEASEFV